MDKHYQEIHLGIWVDSCYSGIKSSVYVIFMHIISDQELFDSKVQSIVGNVQISYAKINEFTCEVSWVSEVSIVCSEHKISTDDKLPIVVQIAQFQGEQSSVELEQPSGFPKNYSQEILF